MKDLTVLDKFRNMEAQTQLNTADISKSMYGIFTIPVSETESAKIIADTGVVKPELEHVAILIDSRYPTLNELYYIKNLFFNDYETVTHYLKPTIESASRFVVHLWKSTTQSPSILEADVPL